MEAIGLVDIGNTRYKWAIRSIGGEVLAKGVETQPEALSFLPNEVWVSSVHPEKEALLKNTYPNKQWHPVSYLQVPMPLQYLTPETLGIDRLLAAFGSRTLFAKGTLLVLDAGTCITLDLITEQSGFEGGTIHPGMAMRLKAMHNFTGALPNLEPDFAYDEIRQGLSTHEAMQRGAVAGTIGEMQSWLEFYHNKYPDLKVICTGGDASIFEKRLKGPIFVESDLVLTGLFSVALHVR
jgi:type III pantothenate kinase